MPDQAVRLSDVFFGAVLDRAPLPAPVVEPALSIAALEMACGGVGVASVAKTVAAEDLARGWLQDLSDRLLSVALEVTAVRLRGAPGAAGDLASTAFGALGAGPV